MDQINKDVSWFDIGHRQRDRSIFPDFKWTGEIIDEMRRLTALGRSAAQIGLEIGTSRNSVIGKWSRLGIKVPKSVRINVLTPEERKARHTIEQRNYYKNRREKERRHLLALVADPAAVVPLNIAFIDLKETHCRFPYGDHDFFFCGHPKMRDSPYCESHFRVTHEMPRR